MTDSEVMQRINSHKRKNDFNANCTKRLKQAAGQLNLKISKISFPRSRIFYSLGKKTRFGQEWITGLPRDHSLQKIKCQRLQMDDLVKTVFPGCFGLPSIVNSYTNATVHNQSIIPKRLDNIFNLLKILVYRHSVCNYQALLDHYCPKSVIILYSSLGRMWKRRNRISFRT